jgi:hypothetical protein
LNVGDLDEDTETPDRNKIDEIFFEIVLDTSRGNAEEEIGNGQNSKEEESRDR